MSKLLLVAIALLSLKTTTCVGESDLVLVLEDTFEDFNLSLWKHEITLGGGGNFEFQWYDNDRLVSFVEDGVLHIRPKLTADDIGEDAIHNGTLNIWGSNPANLCTGNAFYGCERSAFHSGNYINPVKSARIRTAESFSFTYGKVEVRAKLPRGDWLWPAIWMLPTDQQYGQWPASGEIDIMESRGNSPINPLTGYEVFSSTLHWGLDYQQNQFSLTHEELPPFLADDFTYRFRTFGLIWNETYIGTYLDDESKPVLQVPISESFFQRGGWDPSVWPNPWRGRSNNAPFDRRFYLIINLAVGGTNGYFSDMDYPNKPWIDYSGFAVNEFYDDRDNWLPTWTQSFQIDSVRVWTYPDSGDQSVPSSEDLLLKTLQNRCGRGCV